MADKGLRVKGKTYKSLSDVPEQYRAQWEAGSRQKDPGNVNPDVGPNAGRAIVPHVTTFSGIVSTLAKTYRSHDEAIRHNVQNAHMMRRDPMIMGPLLARQRAVALLNWSVEPEDKTSEVEVRIAKELTKMISMIPRFTEYRRNLLEAVWYGRYAIQHKWSHVRKGSAKGKGVVDWIPVHGDKIMFRYDDGTGKYDPNEIGIKVSPAHVKDDIWAGKPELEYNTEGSAVFLRKWERSRLALHKHLIMDGDYEDPTTAGMIHGVGLRHFLYWAWFQKQETLAQLAEIVERTGMGFTIYYYPAGNEQARAKVEEVAEDQAHKNQIIMPYDAANPGSYGIDQIQPVTAGIPALTNLLDEYWGSWIIRFILGQTLSMRDGGGGLGTGTADLHKESFLQIIEYDAHALDETLTQDLVRMYVMFNYPSYRHINFKFKSHTEKAVPLEKLQSIQAAWSMGAKVKAADVMDLVGMTVAGEEDDALYNPQLAIALKQFRETMNQDREQQVAEELAQQQSKEKESVQRYSKLYAKRAPVAVRRPSRKAPKGFTVGGEASKRKDSSFKPPKEMVYKDPEKNSKDGAGPGDHKDTDWDTTWKQLMGDLTGFRGEMPEEAYGSAGIAAAQKYMPRDPGDKENPDYKYNLQYQEEGDEQQAEANQPAENQPAEPKKDTRAILGDEPESIEDTLARLEQENEGALADDAGLSRPKVGSEGVTGAAYTDQEVAESEAEQVKKDEQEKSKQTDLTSIMRAAGLGGEGSSGTVESAMEAQFDQKPEFDFDESSSIRLGIIRHLTDLHPKKEQPKQLLDRLTQKELDTLTTSQVISRAKSAIQELHKKEGRVVDLSKLRNESDVDEELKKYPADVRDDVKSMFARIPTPNEVGDRVKPAWGRFELMSPQQIEVAKQLANAESATEFLQMQGRGDLVSDVLQSGTREGTRAIMGREFDTPEARKLVAELNNPDYLHAGLIKGMMNYNHVESELDKFVRTEVGKTKANKAGKLPGLTDNDRKSVLSKDPDVTITHPRIKNKTITMPFSEALLSLADIRENAMRDKDALANKNLDRFDEEKADKFRSLWGGVKEDYAAWIKKTGDVNKAGYPGIAARLLKESEEQKDGGESDAVDYEDLMDRFYDIEAETVDIQDELKEIGAATQESIQDIPEEKFVSLYMTAQDQKHENAGMFAEELARRNEQSKSAAAQSDQRQAERQRQQAEEAQELAAAGEIVPEAEVEDSPIVVAGVGEEQFSEMNYEEKRDHVDSLLESFNFANIQTPESGVQSLSESELDEIHSDILSEVEKDISKLGKSRTTKNQLRDLAKKYVVDIDEDKPKKDIASVIANSIGTQLPEQVVTPAPAKTPEVPEEKPDSKADETVVADPPDEQETSSVTTDDAVVDTETTPTETTPTETTPAETTPTETTPTEAKPTEAKPAETTPAETTPAETTPAETKPTETEATETEATETEATVTDDTEEEAESVSESVEDLQRQLTERGIEFIPGESVDELKKRLESGVAFKDMQDYQILGMQRPRLRALLTEAKVPFADNASVGELRRKLMSYRDELLESDEEADAAAQVDEEATADASVDEETTADAAEQDAVQEADTTNEPPEPIPANRHDFLAEKMIESLVETYEARNPGKKLNIYGSEIAQKNKLEEKIASHLSDYRDALVGLGNVNKLHRHAVSVMYGGRRIKEIPLEALRRASDQAEYVINHVVNTRPEELIEQLVHIRADAVESKANELLEKAQAKGRTDALADFFGVPASDLEPDPVTGSSKFDQTLEANTLDKWRKGSGTEDDPYQAYFDIEDVINKELQDAYESKARVATPPPGADPQATRAGAPPIAGTDFADVKLSTERSSLLARVKDRIQRKSTTRTDALDDAQGSDEFFLVSNQQLEDGAKGYGFVDKEELGKLNRAELESRFISGLERKLKRDQLSEDHGIETGDIQDPKFAEYKLLAKEMGFEGKMADRFARDKFIQEKAGEAILAKNKAESEAIIAKNVEAANYKDWVAKRSALTTLFGDAMIGTTGRRLRELPEFDTTTMAEMDSNVLATAEKYLGFNPNEDRFQKGTMEETKKAQVEGAFEHLQKSIEDAKVKTKQYSDFMNTLTPEMAGKLAGSLGLSETAMLEFGDMPLHKQTFVASKLLNHAAMIGGHAPDRTKNAADSMVDSINYLLQNQDRVKKAMKKEYGTVFDLLDDLSWTHISLITVTLVTMSILSGLASIGRSR